MQHQISDFSNFLMGKLRQNKNVCLHTSGTAYFISRDTFKRKTNFKADINVIPVPVDHIATV